jgi:hypothetical protein
MTSTPDITMELAGPLHLEELLPLVSTYHAFEEVESSMEQRRRSIASLLQNKSLGEIWLIRSLGSSIGYIAVCYSYSIEFGGRDAFVDEFIWKWMGRMSGSNQLTHGQDLQAATNIT